jgi:hypothetical protein
LIAAVPEDRFDPRYVRHVPGTSYGIEVDAHLAVTHDTAVLEWHHAILEGLVARDPQLRRALGRDGAAPEGR